MSLKRLKEYLDGHNVKYVTISHSPAYTAQEVAASAHVPGKELAKTVIVRIDGSLAMAVLPASYKVDFESLREVTGAKRVELAREGEFRGLFPDCVAGAMPPFGNLYDLPVYVANVLAEDEEIVFNAGSFTELMKLPYHDYARLVHPKVLHFAAHV
ncbi:MAG TPA: YbaK/EbsC family protein [Gemmatimonadales bacterium]|nr:YbaK/EbsC family protein [Gemmatimonadales bacterium]